MDGGENWHRQGAEAGCYVAKRFVVISACKNLQDNMLNLSPKFQDLLCKSVYSLHGQKSGLIFIPRLLVQRNCDACNAWQRVL